MNLFQGGSRVEPRYGELGSEHVQRPHLSAPGPGGPQQHGAPLTENARDPEQAGLTHPRRKTPRTDGPDPYGNTTTGHAARGFSGGSLQPLPSTHTDRGWRQPDPDRPQVSYLDLDRCP